MPDGPVRMKTRKKYTSGPASPRDRRRFRQQHGGKSTASAEVVGSGSSKVSEGEIAPEFCDYHHRFDDKGCKNTRRRFGGVVCRGCPFVG